MDAEDTIIVMGNPGSGKSTILNQIVQTPIFRSGLSFDGTGVTKEIQSCRMKKMLLVDTPGLNDDNRNARIKASKEIEKLFKHLKNKNVKLFFVITLESGRLRPDDVLVIILINEILKFESSYSIIFNKLESSLIKEFSYNRSIAQYESDLIKTRSVFKIQCNKDMLDQDNYITHLDNKLMSFIANAPYCKVPSGIGNIRHHLFERDVNYLRSEIGKLESEINKIEKDTKKLKSNNK